MAAPILSPPAFETIVVAPAVFDTVTVTALPSTALVRATVLVNGRSHPMLRLENLVVFKAVEETIFANNFDGPPGQAPTGQTVFSQVELRRSDGIVPVLANLGEFIGCTVRVVDVAAVEEALTAILLIEGEGWDPVSAPLTFNLGTTFESSIADTVLAVEQGKSVTATLTTRWLGGPPKLLTYEMIADPEASDLKMAPVRVQLERGQTVSNGIVIHAERDATIEHRLLRIVVDFPGAEQLLSCVVTPPPAPVPIEPMRRRAIMVDHIHREYLASGGVKGPLGYPRRAVEMSDHVGVRRYTGGDITTLIKPTLGEPEVSTKARFKASCTVIFRGFRCIRQASIDQSSSTNEPYFLISVETTEGTVPTVHTFKHQNVVTGTEEGVHKALVRGITPNPMRIVARGFENDSGDPDETAAKLQAIAVEVAQTFESLAAGASAASADGPGIGPAAGAGTVAGIFAGPLGALAAAGIVLLLDLGDDFIGQAAKSLFDKPEDEARSPPKLGRFDGADYNVQLTLDGIGEGVYHLFFEAIVTGGPVQTL